MVTKAPAALYGALTVSDSFGLLPLPITRLIGKPLRAFDRFVESTEPAESTVCEACK